jgi:DNA-binding transcriptional MocR family regulator
MAYSWVMSGPRRGTISYHSIAADLRRALADGTYPAGSQLPSERKMAAAYGCGRDTLRRAVDELVHEGLLSKARGQLTLVRSPAAHQVIPLPPSALVIARPASREEFETLACPPGTPMLDVRHDHIRTVYRADLHALVSPPACRCNIASATPSFGPPRQNRSGRFVTERIDALYEIADSSRH